MYTTHPIPLHTSLAAVALRVDRVAGATPVRVGQTWPPFTTSVTIGRVAECDIQLDDDTVSRQHVRLELRGAELHVVNLSNKGTTLVRGRMLEPGAVAIEQPGVWIQIGRILLSTEEVPTTGTFRDVVLTPTRSAARTLLKLHAVGNRVEVFIKGIPRPLFPSAGRVLMRLCESLGDVVTHSQLAAAADPSLPDRIGGITVPQLVTYVRRLFIEAINNGLIDPEELSPHDGHLAGDDPRELMRRVLQNERGLGYRLILPEHLVQRVGKLA